MAQCSNFSYPNAAATEELDQEPKSSTIAVTGGGTYLYYRKFWCWQDYLESIKAMQKDFQPRPDDIIFISQVKTGTTWAKALLHSIVIKCGIQDNRILEQNPHALVPTMEVEMFDSPSQYDVSIFSKLQSPRLLHTHLPFQALPDAVKACGCKIIYVSRNPRDSFVSLWKYYKRLHQDGFPGFKDFSKDVFFDDFCSGIFHCGPFADHVLSYWRERGNYPNMMFVGYEDLQADCVGCVKQMADFLGRAYQLTEEEAQCIVSNCSFDNLSNLEVNKTGKVWENKLGVHNWIFFRKGRVGDWKNHFTDEMIARIHLEIEKKIEDEGFNFTYEMSDQSHSSSK
eukprot:Gb_12391 [translate_table: standard]